MFSIKFSTCENMCEATYEPDTKVIKFTCSYNGNTIEYKIQDDQRKMIKYRTTGVNNIQLHDGDVLEPWYNNNGFNTSYNVTTEILGESVIFKVSSKLIGKNAQSRCFNAIIFRL